MSAPRHAEQKHPAPSIPPPPDLRSEYTSHTDVLGTNNASFREPWTDGVARSHTRPRGLVSSLGPDDDDYDSDDLPDEVVLTTARKLSPTLKRPCVSLSFFFLFYIHSITGPTTSYPRGNVSPESGFPDGSRRSVQELGPCLLALAQHWRARNPTHSLNSGLGTPQLPLLALAVSSHGPQ